MPKVSIIIATHSRPDKLRRAVESARRAGTDVEIIVVDDASSDETSRVCQEFQGVKYIRTERNQRVAGARNLGMLASTSDYITFLDDDDLRLPDSLEKQIDILEKNPKIGLVYGKMIVGDDDCVPTDSPLQQEESLQGDLFWELISRNFISCGTVVFRKDCIYKVGLLEKNLYRIDDWDLWVRISELYPAAFLDEPVYIWRAAKLGSQQGSSMIAEMMEIAFDTCKNKWMKLPRAAQATKEQKREALEKTKKWMGEMLIWQGIEGLSNRNLSTARKCFSTAIKINPRLFFRQTTILNIFKHLL